MTSWRAGLYVHVPFCTAICPYCDFAVTTARVDEADRFIDALLDELAASDFSTPFDTLYLGGGTPSWLGEKLPRLVAGLRADPRVLEHAVLHVEANPEDVTADRARLWHDIDVGFVSLGVQSFHDDELRFLGRFHDGAAACEAVQKVVAAGVPTVSVDVIFGLPGQGDQAITHSIATAANLGARHLSCYQLTFHEGTPFEKRRSRGELTEMTDPDQARLFAHVHDEGPRYGFHAYEVSNFAATGAHRSRHNSKYWHGAPYLGLGPSAHSFDGTARWWNERSYADWRRRLSEEGTAIEERESLSAEDRATETVMLGLRTIEGVDLDGLARDFGLVPTETAEMRMASWCERGLAVRSGSTIRLTAKGWAITDALAAELELETRHG